MELKDFDHCECNLEQILEHHHTHHHIHVHETAPPSNDHHPPPAPPPPPYLVTNIITVPSVCCRCGDGQTSQQRVDQCHFATCQQLSEKSWVKVFCRADSGYNLTIKHGNVVLAPSDPDDEYQHWYKEDKFTGRSVKDEAGFPTFFLVNKATGQTFKNCIGKAHPLQLVPFEPDNLDECLLLSQSKEVRKGYRAIRMCNSIRLNLDAFGGDAGIHDGITVGLWEWVSGDHQIWKISSFHS